MENSNQSLRTVSKNTFGIHQTIKYFEQSLEKPHNYVRIAKQYLVFTMEFNFAIDKMSLEMFVEKKAAVYKTACRKFLKFAQKNDIHRVYDDSTPNYKGNKYVLAFLANAQLSENSKETYARALHEFYSFVNEKSLTPNRETVLAFIQQCKNNGLSPYTTNTYIAAIKGFVQFCILKRDEIKIEAELVEQMRDVSTVRSLKVGGSTQRKYAKDSLTEKERNHLLKSITNPKDKAIIGLMAYQGLRTVEVVRLSWKDIKVREGKNYLAVWGKGREEKELIPILPEMYKILIDYQMSITRPEGSMFDFKETSSIRKITNKWLKEAGLKRENVSAHSLRHTVAQLMLDKGVPKPMVQRFLRHKSESMTSTYTAKQEDREFLNYEFK
ncbi:tyrosine-type recombinase/integrase [Bernardetia sp. ABR2-2B]|uniref:tyrosine-type recombinase/integrase n=1 Tax=Bernardetia sp. ABR2-2B TaxID=3127472 RepID=UPI0030D387E2